MYVSPSLPSAPNLHHLAAGLLPNLCLHVHSSLPVHTLQATRVVIIFTNFPKAVLWLPIKVRKNKFNSWTSEILHILPPSTSPTPSHVTFPLAPQVAATLASFHVACAKIFLFQGLSFPFLFVCDVSPSTLALGMAGSFLY